MTGQELNMRLIDKKKSWRNRYCKHCEDSGLNPNYVPRKSKVTSRSEFCITREHTEPYDKDKHPMCCPVCTQP